MPDPYPFKGIWRWAVLPSLLALGGIFAGLAGALAGGTVMASDLGYWLIPGFVKAAVEGGALAIGRRPLIALIAAVALGGLSLWVEQSLFSAAYTWSGSPGVRVGTILVFGAMPALMVVAHHVYLRARRRRARTVLAAGLLYPAAAIAGMGMYHYVVFPAAPFSANLACWGVAEGLLAWAAMALAARLADRKAPA